MFETLDHLPNAATAMANINSERDRIKKARIDDLHARTVREINSAIAKRELEARIYCNASVWDDIDTAARELNALADKLKEKGYEVLVTVNSNLLRGFGKDSRNQQRSHSLFVRWGNAK